MRDFVYRVSKKCFLTADMTRRIEGRMSILYPSDGIYIARKTGAQLLKLYLMALTMICMLTFFEGISLYFMVVICMTVYAVLNSFIYRGFEKLELQILEHMLRFIEAVKFRFQFDGMLEEALLDAITECSHEMSVHGQIILDHLRESYIKEKCDYQEVSPNHFFLTFYSLCESVMKYGDKQTDNGSLFIKNLSYLKEDISLEILKKKSVENTFMGLGVICIIPVFCISPIEQWATSNMPELAGEYDSQMGRLITILLAVLSTIIYKLVLNLKYPAPVEKQGSELVKKLMRNSLIQRWNAKYMNRHVRTMIKTEKLLREVNYTYNIAEFCVKRVITSVMVSVICIITALTIGFGWSSLIFGLLAYMVVFYGHVIYIRLKKELILMEREDEIIRFQGIILMLMHADRITIEQILSQLERFAVSFRRQIEEIGDKLSYKGMDIFKEIRDKCDFLPFNRIIDSFIACDDMYIYKAFEDIELDRKYYIEKHRQDNKFYIEQRGAIAKFLSFVPLCAVVIIKLIIPFVMEGMSQMAVSGMQF